MDNLALTYPPPVEGWLNIGVLHTALEGNTAHANYAPCSVAELQAKGYQYWALGHVHEHRVWNGAATIAFPGNLQGRHIRETGPRGALMVTAAGTDVETVERIYVDVLRWQALWIDVAACSTLDDAVRVVGRALAELVENADGDRPMAVRVTLTGASAAHGQLFGLESQLRAEVLAQAAALGTERLWIEKVRVQTTPHDAADVVAARADAVADLQELLSKADGDVAFLQSLQDDLMQMIGKLPHEVIVAVPQLQEIRAGRLQSLVQSTAPSLLAHIAKAD